LEYFELAIYIRLADAFFEDDGKVVLRVGITDYKDLLGTHFSPFMSELVQEGKRLLEVGCEKGLVSL